MADLKTVSLGALTSDGSTPWKQITPSHRNPDGYVNIRIPKDSLGGGTLTIEGSLDAATEYSLGDGAEFLDDSGSVNLYLLVGEYIRATLVNSTSPSIEPLIVLHGTNTQLGG